MKLIVFRDLDIEFRYIDELIGDLPFSRNNVGLFTVGFTDVNSLRGHIFDEVLWVGFGSCVEVAGKAPVNLLTQLHWNDPIYHFCNPTLP